MFSKSAADVFRQRQAVADLRFCVTTAPPVVFTRVAVGAPGLDPQSVVRHVASDGLIFDLPRDEDLLSAILFAAAIPDDDFPAFIAATQLLLLDRLLMGDGRDDLYWNWDALSDHYRLADTTDRVAIMGGFRALITLRDLNLPNPPSEADCLSAPDDAPPDPRQSPEDAGQDWSIRAKLVAPLSPQERSHFRHLVERDAGLAPPDANTCATVPPLPRSSPLPLPT